MERDASQKQNSNSEEASGTIEGDYDNPVFRRAVNREALKQGIAPVFGTLERREENRGKH